ncbi:MAG TPA: PAS domain S-box protein [Thermoplasmatales archaeon]|nr:PAS domain S-box protein [Thermoplasmatales archaeon]
MGHPSSQLTEALSVGLFTISGDTLTVLNQAMADLTGFTERQVPVHRFWTLMGKGQDGARECILRGRAARFSLHTDGHRRWVEFRGSAAHDGTVLGCLMEVTGHVQFDRKMQAVEQVAREMKLAANRQQVYEMVMAFVKDVLGYDNCALLERRRDALAVVRQRGYRQDVISLRLPLSGKGITVQAFTAGEPLYVPDVLRNPRYIEGVQGARCEYAVPIIYREEPFGVLDVQNDRTDSITAQDRSLFNTLASEMAVVLQGLRTTEELRKSEARYRTLVEAAKDGIIQLAPDETIMFANQSLAKLVGITAEQLVGCSLRDITTEEQFAVFQQKTAQRRQGLRDTYEAVLVHSSGRRLDVLVSAAPHYTADGGFGGTFAIVTDITRIKEAEERAAFFHSLLRHDISNKNQIILGYLEILADTDLTREQRELVDLASRAIVSSNELIRKVKELQMASEPHELRPVDVDAVLDEVVAEFSSELARRDMRIQRRPIGTPVMGDELTREIFVNLIGNAVTHSGGTTITVDGRHRGPYTAIRISDDGTGIPDHLRPHLFTRRVKGRESAGSGLGLHLVKTIVEAQGGSIDLQDTGKEGTCFEVRLLSAEA